MGGMLVSSSGRPEGSLWKQRKLQTAAARQGVAMAADWNQGRRELSMKSWDGIQQDGHFGAFCAAAIVLPMRISTQ
jgi:hypothetical protein